MKRFSWLKLIGKIVTISTGACNGIRTAVASALPGEGSKLGLVARDT